MSWPERATIMSQLTECPIRFRYTTGHVAKAALHHAALGSWVCGFFAMGLALLAQAPDNLTVTSATPPPYQANVSLTTSGSITVNGSASVIFRAGSTISLEPGFTATAGSAATTFHAIIAPPIGVSVSPSGPITLTQSQTQQFTATVTGTSNVAVSWSINPMVGTVSNGLYTAPATISVPQTVMVTATSVVDGSIFGGGLVSLTPPVGVSVSPSGPITLTQSQTQQFSATVTGTSNTAVTWSTNPVVGTISNGLYTAPSSISVAQSATITVTATSVADSSKSASATINLVGGVPNPPPSQWKGINYSPRYHSYSRMLLDWNTYDSTLGEYVYQAADNDMALLNQNGYNLLHLYLWDKALLSGAVQARWCGSVQPPTCVAPYSEPSGFPNYPNSVISDPQFAALQDFVSRAENHRLFVALHFANGELLTEVGNSSGRTCSAIASDFSTWAGQFITGLTPAHHNVLLWGLAFSLTSTADDLVGFSASRYTECLGRAYQQVDTISRQQYLNTSLTGLGLVGVNPAFNFNTPSGSNAQFVRPGSGYSWDVVTTQKVAKTMTDELTFLYGYSKSPDIYMFQFYNADAGDLYSNLSTLINSNGGDPTRMTIPANQIFPVEFASSSAGSGAESWGDAQTPTTTYPGHNAWLNNTLCTFRSLGLSKYAYWAMYDATSLWANAPWYDSGVALDWLGFWGLWPESPSSSAKPAWSTLASYNQSPSNLSCPAFPAPVLSARLVTSYVTIGQAPELIWTASEMTGLTLNGSSAAPSYSCDTPLPGPYSPFSNNALGGSCAFTIWGYSNVPTTLSYTLSATNGPASTSSSFSVTVGNAPLLSAVMGAPYSGQTVSVSSNQLFYVYGQGFSFSATNYLLWTRPGYSNVYMSQGDISNHYFYQDPFNIMTVVDSRIAPGTWSVYVYNGQSSYPAVISSVVVN